MRLSPNFRTELVIKPFLPRLIDLQDQLFLTGSCFSDHMAKKLTLSDFKLSSNPFGISFNPISIAEQFFHIINQKKIDKTNVFLHENVYKHFLFHSRNNHADLDTYCQQINQITADNHLFLQKCSFVFITLGTAYIYQHQGKIVNNCHKLPNQQFSKHLLELNEIIPVFNDLITKLSSFCNNVKIIFTISPVRHLKDGFWENNQSKATLHLLLAELVKKFSNCFYFPAFELFQDDLRDYRFAEKDGIHPNELAVDYIWQKFKTSSLSI